jgi:glycosyltransferase involved in cell wall biosynthesis
LRLLRRLHPDVIHTVTIKPSLYVGILARALGIKELVIAVSGLGLVFVSKGPFALLQKWAVELLYKAVISPKHTQLIFQNETDLVTLQNIVKLDLNNIHLIKGSGVDLKEYKYTDEPIEEKLIVSLAARLLKEKGIYEFIRAAEMISESEFSDLISFKLIGAPDLENPNSVLPEEWEEWQQSEIVECLGFRKDVSRIFSESNVVVLPSYYGEGLPKVLIEAAACGRAIITTDSPGCRDAILEGETGILIPARDPIALRDAILKLATNRHLVTKMGIAGREYAEKTFSVESVVSLHLEIYKSTLNRSNN